MPVSFRRGDEFHTGAAARLLTEDVRYGVGQPGDESCRDLLSVRARQGRLADTERDRWRGVIGSLSADAPAPLGYSVEVDRLEVAPATVSLMVGDLSRHGILTREEDDADRRRRIVAIAPDYAAAITQWLSGSAAAWTEVLTPLTPAERATIVAIMRAYETALDKHASTTRATAKTPPDM